MTHSCIQESIKKLLELVSKFSKVARDEINIQKIVPTLYEYSLSHMDAGNYLLKYVRWVCSLHYTLHSTVPKITLLVYMLIVCLSPLQLKSHKSRDIICLLPSIFLLLSNVAGTWQMLKNYFLTSQLTECPWYKQHYFLSTIIKSHCWVLETQWNLHSRNTSTRRTNNIMW